MLRRIRHAHGLTEDECVAVAEDAERRCIHCHRCQDHCAFLAKYAMDIGDVVPLNEHRSSCFLCGRCSRICPIGIDGKAVVLALRQRHALKIGAAKALLSAGLSPLEKWRYPFKNYRHCRPISFFPGCSLLSSYPKTTQAAADFLAEREGIGVVYDCCGSPLYEAGVAESVESLLDRLERSLRGHGVQEILVACPHCRQLLEDRLSIRISGVYEALLDLGVKVPSIGEDAFMFPPCPDRANMIWFGTISEMMGKRPNSVKKSQCCGFGGGAARFESALAHGLAEEIVEQGQEDHSEQNDTNLLVYCASCGNALGRSGHHARHVLSLMMAIDEPADISRSFINRAKSTFL